MDGPAVAEDVAAVEEDVAAVVTFRLTDLLLNKGAGVRMDQRVAEVCGIALI